MVEIDGGMLHFPATAPLPQGKYNVVQLLNIPNHPINAAILPKARADCSYRGSDLDPSAGRDRSAQGFRGSKSKNNQTPGTAHRLTRARLQDRSGLRRREGLFGIAGPACLAS